MTFRHLIDELRFREQTARQAPMPGATLPTFVCVACRRIEDAQRMADMFAHEVRDAYEMTAQQADLLEGVK